MSFSHSNSQFALTTLPLRKSNPIHKFAANKLQKRHSKERGQSEQLSPIGAIIETKSTNHHKFSKLCAEVKGSFYKYTAPKKAF